MIEGDCQTYVSDCHVRTATELVSHTWDPVVISALRLAPTQRNELLHRIGGMSDKVLTESLRRLSSHGLVAKAPDHRSAPRRDSAIYRLTALGESFANGPLTQLAQWAANNQADLLDPVNNLLTNNT